MLLGKFHECVPVHILGDEIFNAFNVRSRSRTMEEKLELTRSHLELTRSHNVNSVLRNLQGRRIALEQKLLAQGRSTRSVTGNKCWDRGFAADLGALVQSSEVLSSAESEHRDVVNRNTGISRATATANITSIDAFPGFRCFDLEQRNPKFG